jgi:hypothetical protein
MRKKYQQRKGKKTGERVQFETGREGRMKRKTDIMK